MVKVFRKNNFCILVYKPHKNCTEIIDLIQPVRLEILKPDNLAKSGAKKYVSRSVVVASS